MIIIGKFQILIFCLLISEISFGQMREGTLIKNGHFDTTLPKIKVDSLRYIILDLQEKCELQELELGALKRLKEIDTTIYGRDSIVISFLGENDSIIKTIKRLFGVEKVVPYDFRDSKYYGDSIITYFNESGLLIYQEKWKESHNNDKKLPNAVPITYWRKLTFRRLLYDNKNRVIKQLIFYPTPMYVENTFTYDKDGNQIQSGRRINSTDFWGSVNETLGKGMEK